MKSLVTPLALIFLFGCGAEEAAPAPEPEPEVEAPAPEPEPEPEPAPEPLAECPEDTWAVGVRGNYQPAADGPAAATIVREMARGSWSRISICRTVDGEELQMICAPGDGSGAECSLGIPGRRCSTSMPGPVLPVAAGDFVDNSQVPGNSEWHCSGD